MSLLDQQPDTTELITFLWSRYKLWLNAEVEKRREAGDTKINFLESIRRAPAESFVEFSRQYLAKYPCTETFPADGGLGLRLANGVQVVVGSTPSSAQDRQGNQPDTSVPITAGRRSVARDSSSVDI